MPVAPDDGSVRPANDAATGSDDTARWSDDASVAREDAPGSTTDSAPRSSGRVTVTGERDRIRALRSRGTFQIVFGAAVLTFAVVAVRSGAGWWTVVIGGFAGTALIASGVIARRVAAGRRARLEARRGADARGPRPMQTDPSPPVPADPPAPPPQPGASAR